MKFAAPLLLLLAVMLSTACTTAATRRDMYRPKPGSGPWTDKYNQQLKHQGIFGLSNSDPRV